MRGLLEFRDRNVVTQSDYDCIAWKNAGQPDDGPYPPYEYAMKLRILCSGECNIRVDLLAIYPLLLVISAVGLISSARATYNSTAPISLMTQQATCRPLLPTQGAHGITPPNPRPAKEDQS